MCVVMNSFGDKTFFLAPTYAAVVLFGELKDTSCDEIYVLLGWGVGVGVGGWGGGVGGGCGGGGGGGY